MVPCILTPVVRLPRGKQILASRTWKLGPPSPAYQLHSHGDPRHPPGQSTVPDLSRWSIGYEANHITIILSDIVTDREENTWTHWMSVFVGGHRVGLLFPVLHLRRLLRFLCANVPLLISPSPIAAFVFPGPVLLQLYQFLGRTATSLVAPAALYALFPSQGITGAGVINVFFLLHTPGDARFPLDDLWSRTLYTRNVSSSSEGCFPLDEDGRWLACALDTSLLQSTVADGFSDSTVSRFHVHDSGR